jgi:hypothetical protein
VKQILLRKKQLKKFVKQILLRKKQLKKFVKQILLRKQCFLICYIAIRITP